MTLINVSSVSKYFEDRIIFCDINFQINLHERIALTGSSGCGKSTFLHVLCGLLQPDIGSICWQGQDIQLLSKQKVSHLRGKFLGFVHQFHHLANEFTVVENISLH